MNLMRYLIYLIIYIKKHNKLNEYNRSTSNMISTKNAMLDYLRIMWDELIDTFSTPRIINKISNVNHKGYVRDTFKKIFENKYFRHTKEILDLKKSRKCKN